MQSKIHGFVRLSAKRDDHSHPPVGVTERAVDWFRSPFVAVAFTVLVLLLMTGAYVVGHSGANSGEEHYKELLDSALEFSPDGRFQPTYDDAVLGRLFAPTKIVDVKERIAAKAAVARRQTEVERRRLLDRLRLFLERSLRDTGPLATVAPASNEGDEGIASVDINQLRIWLATQNGRFAPEKTIDRDYFVGALVTQGVREKIRKQLLDRELHSLDSGLSFTWLRIDGAYWVLEVVGWTVFGFLANTLISLFKHCRKGTYSPDEFILIVPKLALAPLLSVVAVALWSSGVSSAPINFLNLPIFLIFSFSLGFCTEQLYLAVKDLTGWVISRFVNVSEDRVAELAKNVPYAFVNPPPATASTTPENLFQLREQLKNAAKAGFERGAVAKLSSIS